MNSRAGFYEKDIRDNDLIHVFEDEKPDFVIHEAAQIYVSNSVKNPIEDAEINITGSINVLEACRQTGIKRYCILHQQQFWRASVSSGR